LYVVSSVNRFEIHNLICINGVVQVCNVNCAILDFQMNKLKFFLMTHWLDLWERI